MTQTGMPAARLRLAAGRFGEWWTAAMWDWVPARWRVRWQRPADRLLLEPEDGVVQLRARVEGRLETLGRLALPAGPAELERCLPAARRALPRCLLLPAASVLRRPLRLPLAALSRAEDVLRFEIDRQTPFAADQVHHAAYVRGPAGDGQADVELVVVPVAVMAQARQQLGPLAAGLAAVDVATADGLGLGVNLLPPAERVRPVGRHAGRVAGLLALAVLLAAGAAWKVLDNRRQALEELQAAVQALAADAREVAVQRQHLQALVDGANFFEQRRRQRPDRTALLEELSRRLPDGTWLERLSVEGQQLQLAGTSDQAAALVAALDGSPLWEAPTLAGVLQSEAGDRRERFTLTATLRGAAAAGGADGTDPTH